MDVFPPLHVKANENLYFHPSSKFNHSAGRLGSVVGFKWLKKKKHIRYSIYVGYNTATNHVYTKFLEDPTVCLIERLAKQQVGGFSMP